MVNTQLLRIRNVHTKYCKYFRGFLKFALAEFARNTRKLMYHKYFHFYSRGNKTNPELPTSTDFLYFVRKSKVITDVRKPLQKIWISINMVDTCICDICVCIAAIKYGISLQRKSEENKQKKKKTAHLSTTLTPWETYIALFRLSVYEYRRRVRGEFHNRSTTSYTNNFDQIHDDGNSEQAQNRLVSTHFESFRPNFTIYP